MRSIIILCALALTITAYGQVDSAQTVLSFDEAVKIALDKNINLKTQENAVDRANAQLVQAGAQMLLPSVQISGDIYGRKGRQQIQNPETSQVEFVDVVSNNFGGSLNASFPLFNGLNRIQTFRAGITNLRAQAYGEERARQTVVFTVAQQYMQILLSYELYLIAKDNHRNQTENLRQILEKVELGALAPVDQYNQLAEVKRLEAVAIQALNAYETDKLLLAQTLQLEPGFDFRVENPGFSVEYAVQLNVNLDELYETAITSRPDFMQQRLTVRSNAQTVNALRGNYLPSLSMFYNYGTGYNSQVTFSMKDQILDINPYHFYGLSFSIPILNGFNTRTRVQLAKIDLKNSALIESNLKTTIYREVKTAYLNYETSKASYVSAVNRLEAATEAYDLEKERYNLGASSFFEFSQANNALILGQAAKAQAEYTLMFQETILNYQIGKLKL